MKGREYLKLIGKIFSIVGGTIYDRLCAWRPIPLFPASFSSTTLKSLTVPVSEEKQQAIL